jgi:hypothetical protein
VGDGKVSDARPGCAHHFGAERLVRCHEYAAELGGAAAHGAEGGAVAGKAGGLAQLGGNARPELAEIVGRHRDGTKRRGRRRATGATARAPRSTALGE